MSLLYDRGSGYVAVVLSAILTVYLFIEPRDAFWIERQGDRVAFAIYIGLGFGIAAVTEKLRKTLDALQLAWKKVDASDREKDLMLTEIHHRIRNDLQLISAQLSLAAKRTGDIEAVVSGTTERIGVLARVYGRLRRIGGASIVDAKEFLESLVQDLQLGMVGVRPILLSAEVEGVDLDMATATAVGTIANELVTNAVKYAFPNEDKSGLVRLSFRREGAEGVLVVSDNGTGITSTAPKGTGLGRQIVQQLAAQLRGTLDIGNGQTGGVTATLRFPLTPP
ncbi:hypothetical protein [Azospirillum doebereinerae]